MPLRPFSVKLPDDIRKALDANAESLGRPRAEILGAALMAFDEMTNAEKLTLVAGYVTRNLIPRKPRKGGGA